MYQWYPTSTTNLLVRIWWEGSLVLVGMNQVKTNPKVKSLAGSGEQRTWLWECQILSPMLQKRLVATVSLSKRPGHGLVHYFPQSCSYSRACGFHSPLGLCAEKTKSFLQPLGSVRVIEAPLRDTGCHLTVSSSFKLVANCFCKLS